MSKGLFLAEPWKFHGFFKNFVLLRSVTSQVCLAAKLNLLRNLLKSVFHGGILLSDFKNFEEVAKNRNYEQKEKKKHRAGRLKCSAVNHV